MKKSTMLLAISLLVCLSLILIALTKEGFDINKEAEPDRAAAELSQAAVPKVQDLTQESLESSQGSQTSISESQESTQKPQDSIDESQVPTQEPKDLTLQEQASDQDIQDETPDPTKIILHPASDRVVFREGFSSQSLPAAIIEKINGVSYHENDNISLEDLSYLQLLYMDFDGNTQVGELICNNKIADDLLEIFTALYDAGYPIEKIRLVDEYGADDDASCADNNTSCFNYRVVPGSTHLSNHAKGLAIDINPFYNPYVTFPDGKEHISPPGSEPYADRSNLRPYMIHEGDLCYQLFHEHGFTWGGHWKSLKDYQHFEKP